MYRRGRDNNLSQKRKFIFDGVFNAELYEYLKRELSEDGFASFEHTETPHAIEIAIRATKTKEVLGEEGRRIRELTSLIQKRFAYMKKKFSLYVERIETRGLSAMAQSQSLRYKLQAGVAVRRAAMGIIRYVMEAGAKGCEVAVGGKVKGQRAKTMKFRDGYMIKSGAANKIFVDTAIRHLKARAGTLGVRVKIMLPHDPEGKRGPSQNLPDVVTVLEPKA